MLTQRGRYALKALIYLAQTEGSERPRQIGAIAAEEQIPRKFLEAILVDLKRARLVESVRGQAGGYRLARPAEEIMFGDIIRATDGPLALVPCVSKLFYRRCDDCVDEATCAIRHVMAGVRDTVSGILDQTSLADAIRVGAGERAPHAGDGADGADAADAKDAAETLA
ncbi:RrF2 family transcriptional regulator [Flavisphingomonas formosensis]|uniref:RrF2 family transcriptional regulator n=1 Tax=Flavisphingomonas formosensis TaxID=861534 RepID=UPI0012F8C537|nr:Rrf2 family transcriptional regulator [Sphingomonas formosensis]